MTYPIASVEGVYGVGSDPALGIYIYTRPLDYIYIYIHTMIDNNNIVPAGGTGGAPENPPTPEQVAAQIPEADLDQVLADLAPLALVSPLDYEPHPKQFLFHTSERPIRFMCGGNQSGKTEGGAAEDVMHATGIYPEWYTPSLRFTGPTKGRIVVTDYIAGGAVMEEKLWHWLPKHLVISVVRTQHGALQKLMIRHVSGGVSQIEIMTHEQADNSFESWTGHWAHFDEPPPREKFIAMQRGLIRLHGRCWLTLTPISEPWLYDEFIANDDDDVFFITVDMLDNPHLSPEAIAQFTRRLTEDEKEARLHGRFRHLTGLVYKMFDPSVHVIPTSRVKLDPGWPTYFVTDPHDRKPFFSVWAKVDPYGRVYIIDEIMTQSGCTVQQFAKQVLMREMMNPMIARPMDVIRILDPNKGNTPSAFDGLTMKEELANCGLYYAATVNDDITAGHLAVAGMLQRPYPDKPASTTNAPKLYWLRETTKECVRYMQRYTWSDWRGATKDEKGKKEKPVEKFKDFCDCIRYLVMSRPTFFMEDEGDPEPQKGGGATGYGPRD